MKLPENKSMIDVYHPYMGAVRMRFLRRNPHIKTRIECSFKGIEYSVKVALVCVGNKMVERWEAESL